MINYIIIGLVIFTINAIFCEDNFPIHYYVIASVLWPFYLMLCCFVVIKCWKELKK